MNYTAEIQHSKETFQRLAKIQHSEYGVVFKVTMTVIGAVSLLIAVSTGVDSTFSILLLLMGGLAFSGLNLPAQRNADKLISLAAGSFPHTKYMFLDNEMNIVSGENTTVLKYVQIYDLLEDADYFFLFLNRFAGYMIPKRSIHPANLEHFTSSLEEKIGLKRHRVTVFLTLNVRARLQWRKARKQRFQNKSEY